MCKIYGRKIVLLVVGLSMLLISGSHADFTFDATVPLEPNVEEAIERAQEWLVSKQKQNGSWGNNNGYNGMITIALMVNGTTPGKGKYGANVSRAVDYILSTQQASGVLGAGNMYEHALAMLALAEAYGMTNNEGVREALLKAVDLLVQTQHFGGGWRYKPEMMPGDLSVTVMQVMALRASAELGIHVPKETIEYAVKFIRTCWNSRNAGFGYTDSKTFNRNRTGAGVVCLQSLGLHDDPLVPAGIATIRKLAFNSDDSHDKKYFWYGHYYGSIALYHYGGDAWKEYYPRICEKVLTDWEKSGHYENILDTAWAVLVLGVPYRYLPIYQR